jgi:DNA-binding response OmpR family regulator
MPPESERKRVLVVEDDESITVGLELNLQAEGYEVSLAADGERGLELARTLGFDLIVLDVMLPRMNGFEVLRKLRQERIATPIIMLSARHQEMDKVMGLELGAEDYVTKPFSLAEFLARVKANLRRATPTSERATEVVKSGGLELRLGTREVYRGGQHIPLTATEFDVLACLVRAGGRVLSREQIRDEVWGRGHHGTVRTIDNFVLQLRNKVEPDPSDPLHLITVRGVGYRFVP